MSEVSELAGLSFVEHEGRLLARCAPAAGPLAIDSAGLNTLIERAGFGRWSLRPEALATLLARCQGEQAPFEMEIGERRDASLLLEVSPDGLSAMLQVLPAQGGKSVTPQELVSVMAEAKISFGVNAGALKQACLASAPLQVEVARGRPPHKGEDARFELLIELARERVPQTNAQGLIDFRELGPIPVVEAGEPLMRRIPATPGVDGCDVRNRPIAAKPGRDQGFAAGLKGVVFDQADPNLLRAAVKGQPVRVNNGMLVEQLVHLDKVDIASGNISYDGSVQIDGDVMNGMQIKASGDIVVAGTVDGGILEAGGNVQVGGGIIANATVRSGEGVSARFVEHSRIEAGTTISIDDIAMQSDLVALNQIVVGAKSTTKGRLVGGTASAMLLVQAPYLAGGGSSTTTRVQVGVNPQLNERHEELSRLLEKQNAEEDNLKKMMQHLAKIGDQERLERARQAWRQITQAMGQTLLQKREVDAQLALVSEARIIVTQGTTGGVDLLFGKKTFHLHHNSSGGVFSLVEDKLILVGASGRALEI